MKVWLKYITMKMYYSYLILKVLEWIWLFMLLWNALSGPMINITRVAKAKWKVTLNWCPNSMIRRLFPCWSIIIHDPEVWLEIYCEALGLWLGNVMSQHSIWQWKKPNILLVETIQYKENCVHAGAMLRPCWSHAEAMLKPCWSSWRSVKGQRAEEPSHSVLEGH